jgi:hypothetical protein
VTSTTPSARLIYDPPFGDPQAGPPNDEQDAVWIRRFEPPPARETFIEKWLAQRRVPRPGLFASKDAKKRYERAVSDAKTDYHELKFNYDTHVSVNRSLDEHLPEELASRREWGRPGGALSRGRFGTGAAEAGRLGEEKTARILREALADFPGARIFHGLQWPGRQYADIDHVVLLADHTLVIDSKNYRGGHYWWNGSELYREGEQQQGSYEIERAVTDLLAGWPRAGFIVIHSDNDVHVENVGKGVKYPIVAGGDLIQKVRDWALEVEQPRLVRRLHMNKLVGMLKDTDPAA